ncbi:MAG TPA: hypothetical protein VNL71_22685 [Chloroflexota bacterium]|nr:hypothetical protein [Chloroflexota bacterium]
MLITPLAFTVRDRTVRFSPTTTAVPLPPWSGVPVALPLEVDLETLNNARAHLDPGSLLARDEEGDEVRCAAIVDPDGSHTCETDTVLMLVQCGPFEYVRDDKSEH